MWWSWWGVSPLPPRPLPRKCPLPPPGVVRRHSAGAVSLHSAVAMSKAGGHPGETPTRQAARCGSGPGPCAWVSSGPGAARRPGRPSWTCGGAALRCPGVALWLPKESQPSVLSSPDVVRRDRLSRFTGDLSAPGTLGSQCETGAKPGQTGTSGSSSHGLQQARAPWSLACGRRGPGERGAWTL